MVLALTLLAFAALAAFELQQLPQGVQTKEWVTAGTVWLLALVYSVLQVLHLPFPDVNTPIRAMFGQGH